MKKAKFYRKQTVIIKDEKDFFVCECVEIPHRPRAYHKSEYTKNTAYKNYKNDLEYYGVKAVKKGAEKWII